MPLAVHPFHVLLLIGITIVWGINFVVAKIGLLQIPPLTLMALRWGLVGLLLVPFVKRPVGRWREVLLVSCTLGFVHFSLMFIGLRELDAATAAIAIQLQVPFAALLAAFFLGDRLGWRRALGLAIAFAGVAILAGEPRLEGRYLALALVIGASFVWSIANLQIKRLGEIDGLMLNAWVGVFAAPQLLLASLLFEQGQWAALQAADWRAWLSVLYQSVAVVIVGYGLWFRLLRIYTMNQIMSFTLLVPLFGVASGVLLLGEPLTPARVAGGLLTIAGVGIIILLRPRLTAPQAERL